MGSGGMKGCPLWLRQLAGVVDHIITGEADLAFAELCRGLFAGGRAPAIIHGGLVDVAKWASPVSLGSLFGRTRPPGGQRSKAVQICGPHF